MKQILEDIFNEICITIDKCGMPHSEQEVEAMNGLLHILNYVESIQQMLGYKQTISDNDNDNLSLIEYAMLITDKAITEATVTGDKDKMQFYMNEQEKNINAYEKK